MCFSSIKLQGFKKTVADRWEFGNEFFRKGAKHLLSEISRRKATHFQQDQTLIIDSSSSPPPPPPPCHSSGAMNSWIEPPLLPATASSPADFLAALSQDNQRLRRRNSFLMNELTQMKKLYGDIVCFLQNHVASDQNCGAMMDASQSQSASGTQWRKNKEGSCGFPAIMEEPGGCIKLFGVPLQEKERLQPEVTRSET